MTEDFGFRVPFAKLLQEPDKFVLLRLRAVVNGLAGTVYAADVGYIDRCLVITLNTVADKILIKKAGYLSVRCNDIMISGIFPAFGAELVADILHGGRLRACRAVDEDAFDWSHGLQCNV